MRYTIWLGVLVSASRVWQSYSNARADRTRGGGGISPTGVPIGAATHNDTRVARCDLVASD